MPLIANLNTSYLDAVADAVAAARRFFSGNQCSPANFAEFCRMRDIFYIYYVFSLRIRPGHVGGIARGAGDTQSLFGG